MKTRTSLAGIALMLALMLALTPAAVLAAPPLQDGGVDDATIGALVAASEFVYSTGGAGGTPSVIVEDDSGDENGDDTSDAPIEVEVGDLVPYSSQGFTLYLPDNWDVSEGDYSSILTAEDQDSGLTLQFETFGEDVPGLFMIPVFEGIAPMFAESLGSDATIGEVEHVLINDSIPAIRLAFANASDPFVGTMDGAIYILATGDKGYGVYAGSFADAWPILESVVDEAVMGMEIDPELITLQRADDEPLEIFDVDGRYSVQVPAGWYATTTGDEDLGIVFADPEITFVGAGGLSPETDMNDPMLRTLIEATAGALDEETIAKIIGAILDQMDLSGDGDVIIDDSRTTVFPSAANGMLGIVRVAGDAPIQEDIILPVVLYLSIFTDRAGAFIFMGNTDAVYENEDTILQVIKSLQIAE